MNNFKFNVGDVVRSVYGYEHASDINIALLITERNWKDRGDGVIAEIYTVKRLDGLSFQKDYTHLKVNNTNYLEGSYAVKFLRLLKIPNYFNEK